MRRAFRIHGELQLNRDLCARCGTPLADKRAGTRFCSKNCQQNERRHQGARPQIPCAACGQDFVQFRRDKTTCSRRCWYVMRGQALPAPLPRRVCALPGCDVEFQPKRRIQRCCSEQHGKNLCNRERRADGRAPRETWDERKERHHRRRALKKGATVGEPFTVAEIRERDGNRCHLCRRKVSPKPYPHPLSASLDHVIPLTKGGMHERSNVRLAHLSCNVAKGNRGGNEQLLLIG